MWYTPRGMVLREIAYPNLARIRQNSLLTGLDQRNQIFEAIADPNKPRKLLPEIEAQIFDGCQQLIDLFNQIEVNDPILSIPTLSRTKALKNKVGQLPNLKDLNNSREVAFALVNGSRRMIEGQRNRKKRIRGEMVTQAETDLAIGTPSMDISPKTKAVGSALHFIERTMFAHFRNQPDSSGNKVLSRWTKDEILFALEDMAQLRHAQITLGQTTNPEMILFSLINTPNIEDGLGWRKPENLQAITNELRYLLHTDQ